MKWNIGSTSTSAAVAMPADHPPVPAGGAAQCPIDHASLSPEAIAAHKARQAPKAAQCPIDHASLPPEAIAAHKARTAAAEKKECPIDHGGMMGALGATVGAPGALNPVNHIPQGLSATEKAPGQQLDLSTERTMSTIPRPQTKEDAYGGGEDKVWAYPSPQQFYVSRGRRWADGRTRSCARGGRRQKSRST
jgi:cytochrome c heme-lyase